MFLSPFQFHSAIKASVNKFFSAMARSRLRAFWSAEGLAVVLIAIGVLLRVKHYFENRSLWLDEACFAITVLSRSFEEIWRNIPIAPNFACVPLLFSLIEKSAATLWGPHEYALRLFPFLASLLSVGLFYSLARKALSSSAALVALALFALSEPLVYYAAEVKQYSGDVLATLVICLSLEQIRYSRFSLRQALFLMVFGAGVMWLSNAALFVLAGVAMTLTVAVIARRDWRRMALLVLVFAGWAASYHFLYHHFLEEVVKNGAILSSWENSFLTAPLWTEGGRVWLRDSVWAFFINPVGVGYPFWCLMILCIGVGGLWRTHRERCAVLFLPILVTLVAAVLHKYPFRERLLLFLTPAAMILLAGGVSSLIRWAGKFRILVGVVLLGLLFISPSQTAWQNLSHPREKEANRQIMEYLKANVRRGDNLVMNNEAQYQYWYYLMRNGMEYRVGEEMLALTDEGIVQGYKVGQILDFLAQDVRGPYALFRYNLHVYDDGSRLRRFLSGGDKLGKVYQIYADTPLDFIQGRRVWFVFSHVDPMTQSFILWKLDRAAKKVQDCVRQNAAVYLYDFGPG